MTDLPELFLSVAAFALLVEALRRESDWWLAAAVIVTIASFFVRQIGILNAIVPLIATRKKKFTVAYGAATLLYVVLLASGALIVSRQELQIHMLRPGDLLIGAAHYAFLNFQNAALFFLPVIALAFVLRPSRIGLAIFAVWFGAIAWHLIAIGRIIPYPIRGNVFINFALGPPTLRDTFVFRMPYPFHAGVPVLMLLMVLTSALAVFLATILFRPLPAIARIAAIYCICGTAIVMFMRIYFDRYSIDTMWPLAIVIPIAVKDARLPRVAAVIALAVMIVFSVAGTAEYLAWNRARWAAFRWLQIRGVTLDQMDGGYEGVCSARTAWCARCAVPWGQVCDLRFFLR